MTSRATSSHTANLEVILTGWVDALRRRDLDAVGRVLAPDVTWQGLRPELRCGDRDAVLLTLLRAGPLPAVEALELQAHADQVLLRVRAPDLEGPDGAPLDGELHQLFTLRGGLVVGIQAFRSGEEARAAMRSHRPAEEPPAAVAGASGGPAAQVGRLVACVGVADLERSIAFYELLGFQVTDLRHEEGAPPVARLRSGAAELALVGVSEPGREPEPIHLYTEDLDSLYDHLAAHRATPGAVHDAVPGPGAEMRVTDPDGHRLVIAQARRDR